MTLILGIAISILLAFVERLLNCFEMCKKTPKSHSYQKELLIKDLISDFKNHLYKMDLDRQLPNIRAVINSLEDIGRPKTSNPSNNAKRFVVQLVKEAIDPSSNFGQQS